MKYLILSHTSLKHPLRDFHFRDFNSTLLEVSSYKTLSGFLNHYLIEAPDYESSRDFLEALKAHSNHNHIASYIREELSNIFITEVY